MKNIIGKTIAGIISVGLLVPAMVSCDYLDQQPDNLQTDETIWQSRSDAIAMLNTVYSFIELPLDDYTTLGVADESSVPMGGLNARKMIEGNWGPSSTVWDQWGQWYQAIRAAMTFEANIDRVPDDKIGQELKDQYKAEAVFLRGWYYWRLLLQYGPFVILEEIPNTDTDYSTFARSPFDDCVKLICDLMEEASRILPGTWPSPSNLGRPTKATCLAVKSQALLLAASELWNGNSEFANFTNKDGTPLAPQSYDPGKWKLAADAAKDVIDLNIHKLHIEGTDPYLSCRNLFLKWNDEIIFSTNRNDYWQWGHDKRANPAPGGYNMLNATQNIVDAFYTRKGLDIHDDPDYKESGFADQDDPENYGYGEDEINRGYLQGTSNMYVNREPRFYAWVSYNGCPVLSAPSVDDKNEFSTGDNINGLGRAEYYYSGASGAKSANSSDLTGYNIIKRVSPASNIVKNSPIAYRPFIHIRYAEILLNYIEALNEHDPAHNDIVYYLGLIRERAGIPNISVTYAGDIGDKDAMREWILRERQIELAFEGDRYWTLCRRKLWEKDKYRKIERMNVNEDDQGLGFGFEGFYTRTNLADRVWHSNNRMYLFPISQYEIDRGKGLVQNPGW